MVTLCAKIMSSKGSFPKMIAMAAPKIITSAIAPFTALELSALP